MEKTIIFNLNELFSPKLPTKEKMVTLPTKRSDIPSTKKKIH